MMDGFGAAIWVATQVDGAFLGGGALVGYVLLCHSILFGLDELAL